MLLSVLREAKYWRFAVDHDAPSEFAHRVSRAPVAVDSARNELAALLMNTTRQAGPCVLAHIM